MKINFFRCNIVGDVDVAIYAAEPIQDWLKTEHGQWVVENAHDPRKITEYFLRWSEKQ